MRRLLCIVSLLAAALPARAQISPGELARPHEPLEGMTNCLKCHDLGEGPSAEKCLACHSEIAARLDAGAGYHFRAVKTEGQACFSCHSDHAGRSFDLVHWPDGREAFDHSLSGWALSGAHTRVKCRECHAESRVDAGFARAHPRVNPSRTFLGLDGACASCHADPHAGQFSRDCAECHGDRTWKPAARFDHALSAFPLRGRHASLDCSRCHTPRGGGHDAPVIRYAGIGTGCAGCHNDPHAGRFGADCASCHGEEAWRPVTAFDHTRTGYRLTGKHRTVSCAACHGPNEGMPEPRYAGLAHDNCSSCHQDPHTGRLGPDCASCHVTSGWRDAAVAGGDGFDHGRTRFPLVGLHARVQCGKCHTGASKTAELAFDTCTRCHADVHRAQFSQRPGGGACEACHDENGFVPARFTAADHAKSRFALSGAHLAQPCIACHRSEEFAPGETARRFVFDDVRCEACHTDPHGGQFAAAPPVKRCDACHGVTAWSALAFDHDRDASYRLEGAHRRAACSGCHRPEPGTEVARYRGVPTTCAACHVDPLLQLGGSE